MVFFSVCFRPLDLIATKPSAVPAGLVNRKIAMQKPKFDSSNSSRRIFARFLSVCVFFVKKKGSHKQRSSFEVCQLVYDGACGCCVQGSGLHYHYKGLRVGSSLGLSKKRRSTYLTLVRIRAFKSHTWLSDSMSTCHDTTVPWLCMVIPGSGVCRRASGGSPPEKFLIFRLKNARFLSFEIPYPM